jgi:hypothetical protein
MKKKVLKIAALVIAVALIICVCVFANSLVGNPVSKMLATNTAKQYIRENHPDKDYQLEGVTFNFKFVCYNAYFVSPSSPDSSFTLMLGMDGQIVHDYYEAQVINRENAARRLENEYRAAVGNVLDNPSFPYDCHIGFGDLAFIPEEYKNDPEVPSYALITNDLELDGIYNINKLGAKAGKLTVYIYDKTVSVERLAEVVLDIKGMLDDAGVSFYVMDCVLEYPKPESGEWKQDRVEVMNFLYADIYEAGMVDRVRVSNDAAGDYYDEMDAIKKEEAGK